MKLRLFFLCLLMLLAFNETSPSQQATLNGFWVVVLEGDDFIERYLFRFEQISNDSLEGKMYFFRNGEFRSQAEVTNISLERNICRFRIRAPVEMKFWGIWVPTDQSLNGELTFPDGTEIPWTMNRIPENEAQKLMRLVEVRKKSK